MPPKRKIDETLDHSAATPRTSRSQPRLLPLTENMGPNATPEAPPKPFAYTGHLADLRLESLSTAFPELSQAQQHMDLWTIFTMPHHDTADETFAAWWEAKPRPHEVYSWGWGHPAEQRKGNRRSGYERTLRAVTTFRVMGEEAQRLGLKEVEVALAVKEMDYIVLMKLHHWQFLSRIPEAEERLHYLFARVRPQEPATIPARSTRQDNAPGTSNIPPPLCYYSNEPGAETETHHKVGIFRQSEFGNLPKVIGCVEAQEDLKAALHYPIRYAHLKPEVGSKGSGVLLFGPSGTGKTLMAQSMAKQYDWKFYEVTAADLLSKHVEDTEKLIRSLFSEALTNKPSIIFIDEVDGLLKSCTGEESDSSRRFKTELLAQWNRLGDQSQVMIVGATIVPQDIDPVFLRRFQTRIRVSLPDVEVIMEMLVVRLQRVRHCITEAQVRDLATLCKGYTGSDVDDIMLKLFNMMCKELDNAEAFQQVKDPSDLKIYYEPCDRDVVGSVRKGIADLRLSASAVVRSRAVQQSDMVEAIKRITIVSNLDYGF